MNENVKKLIRALRSGEYTQTTGQLRYGDALCCLGIACDVYGKETGIEWEDGRFLHFKFSMPRPVQDWFGFASGAGSVAGDELGLTARNDAGHTFDEIADFIESEPAGLFR